MGTYAFHVHFVANCPTCGVDATWESYVPHGGGGMPSNPAPSYLITCSACKPPTSMGSVT